jgi:hypothetical protein
MCCLYRADLHASCNDGLDAGPAFVPGQSGDGAGQGCQIRRLTGLARAQAGMPGRAQPTGQSPDGHRVKPVRRGLREPMPPAAAFRQGGSGRAKEAPPAVGHDPGRLDSRGWRRAFTLCSQSHPCRPQPSQPPPRPCPDDARHQRQDRGRGAARGTCGTGWALRAPVMGANPGTAPATGCRRLPWRSRLSQRPVGGSFDIAPV